MLGLSVPLTVHSILDLLNLIPEYLIYKYKNLELFNGLTIFFCFLVPISFQFSSLVFGFIRNKNDKNRFRVGVQVGPGLHDANL